MWFDYFSLFFSALISATLFPGGSELLLIYYVQKMPNQAWGFFIAGTAGNTLGAFLTYFMGYYFYWGRDKAQQKKQKMIAFCRRYGTPALLFSWLPVVGDALPLIAGWLQLAKIRCLIYILIGKALRYGIIIISTLYLL